MSAAPRVLVVGWSSVLHGEATAGDALSMAAVRGALAGAGVAVDVAWSDVMAGAPGRPGPDGAGALRLSAVDPADYTHVVWACGPLRGAPVEELCERFAGRVLLAVGVSLLEPADRDPVAARFDRVWPRDAPGAPSTRDLAAGPAAAPAPGPAPGRPPVDGLPPVVGVVLAPGQAEYGDARRHDAVHAAVGEWLAGQDAACVALDTRLDPRSWREASAPAGVLALLGRCDVVVSTRLHGLVLALARGVPVLAVDPVAGGGKVTGQASAWGWPALLGAEAALAPGAAAALGSALAWCTSPPGRAAAAAAAAAAAPTAGRSHLRELVAEVLAH